ncbi:MAG: flagellar motor stator protein MotA [Bryobacterales bacterium]|jgi:chemotaxis protein MotA|nr:flagellar motor stator protein MotA [Bryobacterales bacterium]
MFVIIGLVVVFGAVIGGYLMEHGELMVLVQPAEYVIILGAALGTLLIANPPSVLKSMIGGLLGVLKGSPYTKKYYLGALVAVYEIFQYVRKNGLAKLESDIENPKESPLFSPHAWMLKDQYVLNFVCDTFRMTMTGHVQPFELDMMLDHDLEVHHHEESVPVHSLQTVADALPGLGIVAAVLGVVITMGSLGGPPEEIGHKVAAALVGTFLGILFCYGVFAPIASSIEKSNTHRLEFLKTLKSALVASVKGAAPILAVEHARRTIPPHVRPSFAEMEQACKGGSGGAAKAEAA